MHELAPEGAGGSLATTLSAQWVGARESRFTVRVPGPASLHDNVYH